MDRNRQVNNLLNSDDAYHQINLIVNNTKQQNLLAKRLMKKYYLVKAAKINLLREIRKNYSRNNPPLLNGQTLSKHARLNHLDLILSQLDHAFSDQEKLRQVKSGRTDDRELDLSGLLMKERRQFDQLKKNNEFHRRYQDQLRHTKALLLKALNNEDRVSSESSQALNNAKTADSYSDMDLDQVKRILDQAVSAKKSPKSAENRDLTAKQYAKMCKSDLQQIKSLLFKVLNNKDSETPYTESASARPKKNEVSAANEDRRSAGSRSKRSVNSNRQRTLQQVRSLLTTLSQSESNSKQKPNQSAAVSSNSATADRRKGQDNSNNGHRTASNGANHGYDSYQAMIAHSAKAVLSKISNGSDESKVSNESPEGVSAPNSTDEAIPAQNHSETAPDGLDSSDYHVASDDHQNDNHKRLWIIFCGTFGAIGLIITVLNVILLIIDSLVK